MKNLQFNSYQCRVGQLRSKKSKSIPALPCPALSCGGVGLKSYPIPAPPPLWGGENLRESKQGGEGLGGAKLLSLITIKYVVNLGVRL